MGAASESAVAQPVLRDPAGRAAKASGALYRLPLTIGFFVVFAGIGVLSGATVHSVWRAGWARQLATGVPALHSGRWWSVITAPWFAGSPHAYLVLLPLILGGIGWSEWRFGTMRTAALFLTGHLVGTLGAALFVTAFASTGWQWAVSLSRSYVAGPSSGLLAVLAFAVASLPSPWRLRAQIALVAWVGVSVLYLGNIYDLQCAITITASLVASGVLLTFRQSFSQAAEREWRLIALWVAIVIGVVQLLGLALPFTGPFGADDVRVLGAEALVDGIVVAALANALRRGYRVAWIAAVWLCVVAIGSAAVTIVSIPSLTSRGMIASPGSVLGAELFSLPAWLGFAAFLVAGRDAFQVPVRHARRSLDAAPMNRDELIGHLRRHGGQTISWMTTWGRNRLMSAAGGALAYQTHAGVAIGLGSPVVADGRQGAAISEFRAAAERAGLTPCFFAASSDCAAATPQGWRSAVVAMDTIVDLPGISFAGRQWRHVRAAMNRASREGIRFEAVRLRDQPRSIITQVKRITVQWSGDKSLPEMGFTLGTFREALDPEVVVALAIDDSGRVHGVTSWLPVYGRGGSVIGWTLDVMRSDHDGFSRVMDFLIGGAVQHFADRGYAFVSLGGAPLVREPGSEERAVDTVLARVGALIEPLYGFRSLHEFKEKFNPRLEPLSLLYRDEGDLPRIGVALSRAYLPDASLRSLLSGACRDVKILRGRALQHAR